MTHVEAERDAEDPYSRLMVHIVTWVGFGACALFTVVNAVRGIPVMIVADALGCVLLLANALAYRRHGDAMVATLVGTIPLAVLMVAGAHFVGIQVLTLMAPLALVVFFLLGERIGAFFVAGELLLAGGWMVLLRQEASLDTGLPTDVLVSIALVGILGYVYEHVRSAQARELQALSSTDPLTGALNRRSCDRILAEELPRVRRYGRPLSVLLLDIDHFKRINDEHGHSVGDAVLRDVAARMRAILRASDSLVRWGGEEFLVILPETDLAGACVAAERIRRAIAAEPAAAGVVATVSVGAAELRPGDGGHDALIRRADHYLYEAKRSGRNRVCHVTSPAPSPDALLTTTQRGRGVGIRRTAVRLQDPAGTMET